MNSSYQCTRACRFRFSLKVFLCAFTYLGSVCLFYGYFFVFICVFSVVCFELSVPVRELPGKTSEIIGGDSIEARRHVPPHFLEPEARNGVCLPIFWTENIRHAHIEPCPRDWQNIFYICFVSSRDSILMWLRQA